MVDWTSATSQASAVERRTAFLPALVPGSPDVFKAIATSEFLIKDDLDWVYSDHYAEPSDPDDTLSIQRAIDTGRNVIISGDKIVSGSGTLFNIQSRQHIKGPARITHSTTAGITFSAIAVNDWCIQDIEVVGAAAAYPTIPSPGTACALYIEGCNRYRKRNFVARQIQGHGQRILPGTYVAPYADQGVGDACLSISCYYGYENTSGTGAEYCIENAFVTVGCTFGTVTAAGNTQFNGGADIQNQDGFVLLSGTNHGHGNANGRYFSHNSGRNIWANSITLGFNFNNCHAYGDSGGSNPGKIALQDSKGIAWLGGDLDAVVEATGTTDACRFVDAKIVGALAAITGAAAAKVKFIGCQTLTGQYSVLNDPIDNSFWVRFHWDGAAIVIDGGNGATVSRTSAGDYTVTWPKAFENAHYNGQATGDTNASRNPFLSHIQQTSSTMRITTFGFDGTTLDQMDPLFVNAKANI